MRPALDAPGRTAIATRDDAPEARRWMVAGRVQGVGFRPFVYRLAQGLGIRGYVRNHAGQVEIVGEGSRHALDRFARALIAHAPALARPRIASNAACECAGHAGFAIAASAAGAARDIHVPPDQSCCDDCLRELVDPANRRFGHPFINCTQCGPRYTLIERLPYDRANTTMAAFAPCPDCRREYEAPDDRRYHAEPVACPACGPQLAFRSGPASLVTGTVATLAACVDALRAGRIVAVKGVGGYHLMVDAANDAAVARLRERKRRPHKPLAVMFPADGAALRAALDPDAAAAAALADPARPIVLAPVRQGAGLSAAIAPGLAEVGALLPYSPLHHLLLQRFGGPLVATSANSSGEPVLTDSAEVESRLADVADAYLHHDRPIARPADDPVCRVIAGRARPIRLGRGTAPLELRLPFALARPMLAAGGHMKSTVALAWDDRAVISPHIGDLGSPRAVAAFERVIADLQSLYGVRAQAAACDAHPGYASSRWARASGLPVSEVYHHHAHAAALAGEFPEVRKWLVFAWDGVGLGPDGSLWGGEGLHGVPGAWARVTSLRPFRLPGGDRAAREPWRSAAALCWEIGRTWRGGEAEVLHRAWQQRLNCPQTSAAGRVFDAAAALVGLLDHASFEGQGPLWLEALAQRAAPAPIVLPLGRDAAGVWRLDWEPLVALLLDEALSATHRAAVFHASLARGLLEQARAVRRETAVRHVGLVGGVFQNRVLTDQVVALLRADGFDVRLAERLPCNDAALAFGQLVEAGASR
jgi:hydrogenase maturation protein HypF